MVELKGSLAAIGLPAIVELIGELRHSGSLDLSKGPARGLLEFANGRVVAAEAAGETGYKALVHLNHELADAEFTFIEGAATHPRTLDLGSKDLLAYLARTANGNDATLTADPTPVEDTGLKALGTCPLLGFADDQSRQYSRPTALHRCFAPGSPSLVTGQEQRELCLSGRFPTCPRYRNATPRRDATLVSAGVNHSPAEAVQPHSGPVVAPERAPVQPLAPALLVPTTAVVAPSGRSLGEDVPDDTRPGWMTDHRPAEPAHPAPPPPAGRGLRGTRRAMLLVAAGAVIGLIALGAIVLATMWRATSNLASPKPNVAGAQAVAPVPTPTTAADALILPNPAPGSPTVGLPSEPSTAPRPTVSVPTAPPAAVTSAASQLPASAGSTGQPIEDVRFVTGPAPGWVEHPPFATWSDGAFRLQAQQAAQFVAVAAPISSVPKNVVVTATFRKTGGPPGGGYGIILRDQGPTPRDGVNQIMNAYVFEAGDLGELGIWRRDGDHWVDLVPWTRSAAVRPGGSPNELVARATGATLTFSINATQVASVQDETLPSGGVGVFVGGDYNEAALDRFSVQNSN